MSPLPHQASIRPWRTESFPSQSPPLVYGFSSDGLISRILISAARRFSLFHLVERDRTLPDAGEMSSSHESSVSKSLRLRVHHAHQHLHDAPGGSQTEFKQSFLPARRPPGKQCFERRIAEFYHVDPGLVGVSRDRYSDQPPCSKPGAKREVREQKLALEYPVSSPPVDPLSVFIAEVV